MDGDRIENGGMMYIGLRYDDRIMDGKEGVGLLKRMKELIEKRE
ncbi:2-oxo acid dehydrogenase subunit E2, partial [Staphylococcus saprophyticus]